MKMKKLLYLLLFFSIAAKAQNSYTVDISKATPQILSGHLKQGSNTAPDGDKLEVNSLYFMKNGAPWYPVMGEFHFSRFPKSQWEASILKMKAAGIDVIATYVFWIYHEEEEGKFNWKDDNDFNAFLALCKKHQMYVFARIGPWCHGEVRNGGFPDWIVKRGNMRKNDSAYLSSVKKFYHQIGLQCKGMYFKDGGPIIGTQIENEYRFNNTKGLEHLLELKKMAIESGFDVPYYTATGWPGSNLKQDELIPVWGAYPEAPWDKKTTKLALSDNYLFGTLRNDPAIGSDLLGKQDEITDYKGFRYPYATAEMGGGIQVTYHRRPIINSDDVTALAYTKIGSGANLMGYYMFHGGSNKIGKLSTLQESKATNYPNDYPIINYDFQSPIGEYGNLKPSFYNFKVLHTFLNEFGSELATYSACFPEKMPINAADANTLRFAVRAKNNSGFVFISQVERQLQMNEVKDVQFQLKLKDNGNLVFPEKPITIKNNVQAIFPFNMDIEGFNLQYATAQPLCKIEGTEPLYVFFEVAGVTPEFVFEKNNIKDAKATNASLNGFPEKYQFSNLQSGLDCIIELVAADGKKVKILTLTAEQAKNAYKIADAKQQKLLISNQEVVVDGNQITISGHETAQLAIFPQNSKLSSKAKWISEKSDGGVFKSYYAKLEGGEMNLPFEEVTDLSSYLNVKNTLPADSRLTTITTANPGPQYQTNLSPVAGSKYYLLSIPENKKIKQQSFLTLDYFGDTASVYSNGKLIADDFYYGKPWNIGINNPKTKQLLVQIVPLTDEKQIYFEPGIREAISGKDSAGLKSGKITFAEKITLTIK
jgi:beta-galactosidase